jgi:hypothetical protein
MSRASLVHAQRAQAIPSEGDRHPALVLVNRRPHRGSGLHGVLDCGKPSTAAGAFAKRKKFITPRERRRSRQQDVLNVVELEHRAPRPSLHLIEHV